MITALILTFNEEIIIQKCIDALDFVDRIIVLDSGSTDKTIEILESNNIKIYKRKFDNYAAQRNYGLSLINDGWVLMIDSDEIVTRELKNEIINSISSKSNVCLFRVRRKDMFNGKWLRFSSGYPTWFPRLFKAGEVKVLREVNEEYYTKGRVDNLTQHLIHYPFNKGLDWWFSKHNIYSKMEAEKIKEEVNQPLVFSSLFNRDPVVRRGFYKRLSYRIPFRPTVVFLIFFVLKGGFLDGTQGYDFCRMRKVYESMIDVKLKSLG